MQNNFKILFVGDIVGSCGMRAIFTLLPQLIKKHRVDFVIANAENANEGFGVTPEILDKLFKNSVNVITSGNHVWHTYDDNKKLFEDEKRFLTPANYPLSLHKFYRGKICDFDIAVINLQGRSRMSDIDCPFKLADKLLKNFKKDSVIIVDFHADSVFEKEALANYLDGRVSALLGTHTHIQTNDARILKKGTAYITDVGATASEDGVIGFSYEISLKRFLDQISYKNEVSNGSPTLSAVLLDLDKNSKVVNKIIPIKELVF